MATDTSSTLQLLNYCDTAVERIKNGKLVQTALVSRQIISAFGEDTITHVVSARIKQMTGVEVKCTVDAKIPAITIASILPAEFMTKIPRPMNAFMLYRRENHAIIAEMHPEIGNCGLSRIIGDMWRHAAQEVKDVYKSMAKHEAVRHKLAHPEYRYRPRKSTEKRNLATKSKGAHRSGQVFRNFARKDEVPYGFQPICVGSPYSHGNVRRFLELQGSKFDEPASCRFDQPHIDSEQYRQLTTEEALSALQTIDADQAADLVGSIRQASSGCA